MSKRPTISDDDLVVEFCDVFRECQYLRSAILAVANLARRARRPARLVYPPAIVEVARYYCRSREEILDHDRHADVVDPRHVAMWLLRDGGLSYAQVARAMQRTDPSTARHAVARVERNPQLKAVALEIRARMTANRHRLVLAVDRKEAA